MNELTPFGWFAVICGLVGMIAIASDVLYGQCQEYKNLTGGSDE